MTYTKTTWAADTAVTYATLNHAEEQYTEIMAYLAAHDHDDRYYIKADVDSYFWDQSTDGAGSELDADTLEGVESADIVSGADVGIGGWWYGTLGDFTGGYLDADPTWHICNGSGGSIDLREVYILGAGGTFDAGQTGGNNKFKPAGYCWGEEHVLTAAECMHGHNITDFYGWSGTRADGARTGMYTTTAVNANATTDTEGGGAAHEHSGTFTGSTQYNLLPQFIALLPIQKIA
jgi:hypothetical protein